MEYSRILALGTPTPYNCSDEDRSDAAIGLIIAEKMLARRQRQAEKAGYSDEAQKGLWKQSKALEVSLVKWSRFTVYLPSKAKGLTHVCAQCAMRIANKSKIGIRISDPFYQYRDCQECGDPTGPRFKV